MLGCLEVAPEAILRWRFNTIRPLMEAEGEAVLVCVLPIPRYVMKPCCTDTRGEGYFEEILMSGTETCRRVVGVEGAKACLSIFTFNPIAWSASQGPRSDRGMEAVAGSVTARTPTKLVMAMVLKSCD